jgi:hypothetical protein
LAADARLAAQAGNGTLTGTVVDAQGAALPGAIVTVTEQATGAARTAPTDGEGVFRVPALPPGRYTVKVELDSFSPLTVTDVALSPAEIRNMEKLQLKLGQLTDTVTVTAQTAAVQTATSTRYGTVTEDQLTNVMQKGRDIWGLMQMVPGVQDTNMNRNFTTWTSMGDITINGMPNTTKVVVMDGVSIVDELGSNAMVNPNIDAVGEVQIISNGFTAENGRSTGGLIIMTTKSGTSSFKGSAWYNARRDQWNAIDYFRAKNGQPKSLYHVNIPGYSIGGPVIIPKVLDKGKLFFFLSQEFTDDLRESTLSRTNYPTELERAGDFSQTYTGNANGPGQGTLQSIINPDTPGVAFPGNKIPLSCAGIAGCKYGVQNALGQKLLGLLPMPNGYFDPGNNQYNAFNYLSDTLPYHNRTNTTVRLDAVVSESIRGSFRFINDNENNDQNNRYAPGIGKSNNAVPGMSWTATMTSVLRPTLVNETTFGRARNNYSWIQGEGKHYDDLRQYYRSAVGIDPPRIEPFGEYRDPPGLGYNQYDEYPYLPTMNYSGGNRANLVNYNPASSANRILPAANRNLRWSINDDLSWTRGRHNFKFGFSTEWASKTEPLNPDYRGSYNFGHSGDNPLSTGNGYANALIGVFTQYTELSNRVDPDRRHWYTEGYAQDSWRMKPNFTLDYGVRFTHTGAFYDTRGGTAGFYEQGWDPKLAPRLYYPMCTTGVPGNQTCAAANIRAYDKGNPNAAPLPSAFVGNLVPGTGSQINGMVMNGYPGNKPGEYFDYTPFVAAPRVGIAWDVRGDGKQAIRASTGIFFAVPTRGFGGDGWEAYYQAPKPPAAYNRVVRWATFADIAEFAAGNRAYVENPFGSLVAGNERRSLEKSYNVNLTYQRDIGFGTTAEVAYVGNFTYSPGRGQDVNRPLNNLYLLSDPSRMFNGNALDTNLLRTVYPGSGAVTKWFDASDVELNRNTLQYNAMQVSIQRRLNRGLQLGMAYTLAKGEGWTGYSADVMEADPTGALNRQRFWGPTNNNRPHNLNINYSYQIPNPTPDTTVLTWVLRDWQVSGVTKYLSGQATQPSCSTTTSGVFNTNPTLTPGASFACEYTGEDVFAVTRDPNLPEEDQVHFNPAAFRMPVPYSSTLGNFGNVPIGILRQPGYLNWDLTFARAFPVPQLTRNAQVRLQLQFYNLFNTAQFTQMNTTLQFADDPNVPGPDSLRLNSTLQGRYTDSNPPRYFGVTARLDF